MSAKEKMEFKYNWKFKHFHRYYLTSKRYIIHSPSFKIEYLERINWNLVLEKYPDSMLCGIKSLSLFEEPTLIEFQYEITTVDGVVLETSDVLRHTFEIGNHWSSEGKIRLDDRNTPEEFCLRCRIISYKNPSEISRSFSAVSWEAETDIVAAENTFKWFLVFSESNFLELTAIKTVTVENILIDVMFTYTGWDLKIELIPKIVDNKFHFVSCLMQLEDGKSGVIDAWQVFTFSRGTNVHKLGNFNRFQRKEAKFFITNKFNLRGVFEYLDNSLITEIKSSDSTAVKCAALTQNKEETECIAYLQQHLRIMLNEKIYSDVELRADDEVFFAHKNLLAGRSPVFKAMFDQDMLESKTNIVNILETESKILKCFLEYIYTGDVKDLDDAIALKLLVVADKYQVSPLTERCSAFLKSALSLDNVLNVLLVADLVNQEQLKFSSVEFIIENSTEVLSTPTWPQWVKENHKISSEILLKLSKKFDLISNCNKA